MVKLAVPIFFLMAVLCPPSWAQAEVLVDMIEVYGTDSIDSKDIEASLEVSVGDPLDRERVVRTVRNIENLYLLRGFEKASVRTELRRRRTQGRVSNVFVVSVEEGKQSRVASLDLRAISLVDKQLKQDWNEIRERLLREIKVSPGDPLDRDVLNEVFLQVQTSLEEDDFVGARLVRFQYQDARAPTEFVGSEIEGQTLRWVDVVLEIDLGDRVSFGFRGNKRFSRLELLELVYAQRAIGFGKAYASDIQERIIELYQSKGYANVEVKTVTFEKTQRNERHVTYFIEEKERVRIERINFDGNEAFSEDFLEKKFFDLSPVLTSRNYYVAKETEEAAELLIDWIKSQGYLSAKFVTIDRTFIKGKTAVNLMIFLYEGDQTRIRNISLSGFVNLDPQRAREVLQIDEGEPLDLFAFSEGIQNLKAMYRDQGYLTATLENEESGNVVAYSQENRVADISLVVNEGPRYRVGNIFVEGLTKTNVDIAERELTFKRGDVLSETTVAESEARLRKLGLFGSVKIQHRDQPGNPGFKDVRVLLSEGTPGLVAGGVGIRNDLGLRVFGSAGYTNIWHRNHAVSLTGSANRRFEDFCVSRTEKDVCFIEYKFRLGYSWPWFLAPELRFRPSITQEKRRFIQFDALSTVLAVTFERPLWDPLNLMGRFTYNLETTKQFNAAPSIDNPDFSPDNQTLRIGSIIPSLSVDLRDRPLAPSRGFYAIASYEIASTKFGSQNSPFPIGYTKSTFRADQHIPLPGNIGWYLSFRTGLERNTIDPTEFSDADKVFIGIPLIKQFTLGGAASLRGFKEQELNFTSKAIQGTLSFVNYRTQVDFPIVGEMRFGPFLDAGNLMVDRYSLGDLRYGAGFGFHYLTPVGPVNFDWGFKLDRQTGEEAHRFYFTVGIL